MIHPFNDTWNHSTWPTHPSTKRGNLAAGYEAMGGQPEDWPIAELNDDTFFEAALLRFYRRQDDKLVHSAISALHFQRCGDGRPTWYMFDTEAEKMFRISRPELLLIVGILLIDTFLLGCESTPYHQDRVYQDKERWGPLVMPSPE
jgi:hypothetical protein